MSKRPNLWPHVAAAVVFGTTACSLYLDWDRAGLPCDDNDECYEGYSCLVNTCVEEKSVAIGDTCSADVQCAGSGTICGAAPFTCRERCPDETLYGSTTQCGQRSYCRPEPARPDSTAVIGTCFDSECSRDTDCKSDRICVPIELDAGACLLSCQYDFENNVYQDNCGSRGDVQTYCQPVGLRGKQQLACLERLTNVSAPVPPELCNPVQSPCVSGAACVVTGGTGKCYYYCRGIEHCGAGEECCPVVEANTSLSGPLYSVCKPAGCL